MLKSLCKFWIIAMLLIGGLAPVAPGGAFGLIGLALADDHDEADDDDDDDDDAPVVRRAPPRAPVARTTRPAPVTRAAPASRPNRAPDEIVAPGLDDDDFQALLAQGYTLIEAYQRPDARIARRLRIPDGTALPAARDAVRGLASGDEADFNHFYRSEQAERVVEAAAPVLPGCTGNHCAQLRMIGWNLTPERARACAGGVTIGLIDTGLNEQHQTFDQARLEVIRLAPEALPASQAVHGTAIAALLVGDPASRSPGLLPGAQVIAVDAFHRDRGDERADVFTLIKGLTQLAERGADVINLSLAGPQNSALKQVIDQLTAEQNVIIVAAVGNAGSRARPLFPAAYGSVIAVTAVDEGLQVYRRAVNGRHVDLAAPGVDVWTAASISGVRPKTGTSFAVPFVTAAIALMRGQNPQLTTEEALQSLSRGARDLGAPGRDPVFGHGLIRTDGICPP